MKLYKLKFSFSLIAITIFISFLNGCAPATYIQLSPENANKIHATKVYSIIAQEEISAKIDESKNHGELYKNIVRQSIQETMKMLRVKLLT